jgi:hypothetical protein
MDQVDGVHRIMDIVNVAQFLKIAKQKKAKQPILGSGVILLRLGVWQLQMNRAVTAKVNKLLGWGCIEVSPGHAKQL